MNKLNLFKNSEITQEQFLKEYWHKKPLLIKNAVTLNDLSILPNKTQIQQLSCDKNIQSRIVLKNSENQYDVEYGPFIETDFDELDQDCWN
ncbi:MAG: cupin domain-containing protein, partial [Proteobacteria bacterium]|nr:cupin domain-containing protein [Pseudomonadota bacterium]